MNTPSSTFQSERKRLTNTRMHQKTLAAPASGEVVVKVDHFALTANNITYGVAGDSIGYWQFFPAEGNWGCIPVWGFGDVVESNHPQVQVGERLYGYFPMATHVKLTPEKITEHGLVDGAAHRAKLPVVYNQYTKTATDPSYNADQEAEQMLYRPLFTTSFFLDDFLEDNQFFGAGNVILTSASSKTSIGLAHLLHKNRDCRVIGLTSAGNKAFVESLGCYHQVITYDNTKELSIEPSVMVDMAGSGKVRASVHGHLKDALKYSCAVGATHWEDTTVGTGQRDLPGPKPAMFFAPSQIQKRLKEWGRNTFEEKMAGAWSGFAATVGNWIEVERCTGEEELRRVYDKFMAGSADPAKGYVMSLTRT